MPDNSFFYQYPRSGNGMAGEHMFYDKTPPHPPVGPYNFRDNLVGRLYKNLSAGKTYCVSFWVNMADYSGRGQNKIGAYLDDGTINSLTDTFEEEITSVRPQVFTNTVITDTANWVKIEGSFIANGSEHYITIGNFFPNDSVNTVVKDYWHISTQYSYYLIDDVSVIPIDLNADAGKDAWVEKGKIVQIGRMGDTTAQGLDCKWYYKGALIDSGAIISVHASSIVGATDTYAVVQTICGLMKTDTVLVRTVSAGISLPGKDKAEFQVYPNPSDGQFTLTVQNASLRGTKQSVSVYDLMGRVVHQQTITEPETQIRLYTAKGTYILELKDEDENLWRDRIVLQ